MRMAFLLTLLALAAGSVTPASAQAEPVRWQRRTPGVTPPLTLFRSTHSFGLPTAEVLSRGEFEMVIAHRFNFPVGEGNSTFLGLDGPATIRLSLAYAPTGRTMVTLGRTNWHDNLDLTVKLRALEHRSETLPFAVALTGGGAWNMEMPLRNAGDHRNFQFYGQLVANTLLGRRLALGVVPSYLHNPAPEAGRIADALAVGANAELYLSDAWALVTEWTISAPQTGSPAYAHDAVSFGVHFETGGHFFKFLLTNSPFTNLSQQLAGTPYPFRSSEWRLGFNVTRRIGHRKHQEG